MEILKHQEDKDMKKTILALIAFTTVLLTGCMNGDWDDPQTSTAQAYGNQNIKETNVVTLTELRNMPKYKNVLNQFRDYKLVDDDIQLRLRVTGNDIGGNIYNKVCLQDKDGEAIIATVYAGGLFAYLPVGQEIVIDLKGLYIGCYGYQQQIGVPYTTASGNSYPGRMPNWMWQEHIKLVETTIPDSAIEPVLFTAAMAKANDWSCAGKLVRMENVTFTDANGTTTWAPSGNTVGEEEANTEFSISRYLKGYSSSAYISTSTSAKFANDIIPTGTHNVTAILIRYNNYYQFTLRTIDDVE